MPMRFTLYPIHWLANQIDRAPFDHSVLPFDIAENTRIEAVSQRFRPGTFKPYLDDLGTRICEVLGGVDYALVHRYNPEPVFRDGEYTDDQQHSQASEDSVRQLMACLRLVRPMREHAMLMRGNVRDEDGSFDVTSFDIPNVYLHEVPEVQKLFMLRNEDAADLRRHAPEFLRAMRGNFWKFRMAVHFMSWGTSSRCSSNGRRVTRSGALRLNRSTQRIPRSIGEAL
jgi:hypothetical protein